MLKPTLLIASLIFPTYAASQNSPGFFYSGNQLHELCNESRGFVTGFTAGMYDTRNLVGGSERDWELCFPENGTLGQAADVVCKYVNDNPNRRHWYASALAGIAIREASPCPALNWLQQRQRRVALMVHQNQ